VIDIQLSRFCVRLCLNQVNAEGLVPATGPGVGECLQDSSSPVRLAAERCAFHLFQLSRGSKHLNLPEI
jgi:hypothetical protein